MSTDELIVQFANPEKRPLEQLTLSLEENGVTINVPALDKRWVTKTEFSTYEGFYGSGAKAKSGAELEEWLHISESFLEDMNFLLGLRHHEFWSYMVYGKSALHSIILFLRNASPFYLDLQQNTTDERVIELHTDILTAVVRIVCRIITNKESEDEWMSIGYLKELIYPNFLISIPMIFDLLIALGDCNLSLLVKIVNTLFEIEPKYKDDLTSAIHYMASNFETIERQMEDDEGSEDMETPFDDITLFTLDCAYSLSLLLDVYPEARNICCDIDLGQRISGFYENIISYLYKSIHQINPNARSLTWLNEARMQLLKAFRSMVTTYIEKALMDLNESGSWVEKFIKTMSESLSDRMFVADYQRQYPIEEDVDVLKGICKNVDSYKIEHLTKAYEEIAESESPNMFGRQQLELEWKDDSSCTSEERPDPEGCENSGYDNDQPSTSQAAISRRKLSESSPTRDMETEVTKVSDVLPDLGDGFIRRVLSRYKNSDEAITAILEHNLPPDLLDADRKEVYIPVDPQDVVSLQTGVNRYNVFDGDKYDFMVQDNPDCVIKVGKGLPSDAKTMAELLDDKSEINKIRDRYNEYALIDDKEYEDEYDDSYEAVLDTESHTIKAKHLKDQMAEIGDLSEEETESSEEDSEAEEENASDTRNNKSKFMNFCENPEDVRARYEAHRAAKYGSRGNNNKSVDVVGEPKGHGQDKSTISNRHKKEVHKSSRANHNRKSGAAFKRSRGMIP